MITWDLSPNEIALASGELHVWQTALDLPADQVQRARELLSPAEQERADRFHFDRDRRRFSVARSTLRLILSIYLQQPPDQIVFTHNPYGKPAISAPLHFNVTHAHELALFAVTAAAPVGIDVEYTGRHVADRDALARRFFSAQEVEVYQALAEVERRAAFWCCWTRKEAYIKALGTGLSHPLDRFVVSLRPDQPAAASGTRIHRDRTHCQAGCKAG